MVTKSLDYYLKRFAKLRVDRASKPPAPHKPILLLAVIDLFERGAIQRNEVYLSPGLTASFLKFWHRLVQSTDRHSNIALPFYHLTGERNYSICCRIPRRGPR